MIILGRESEKDPGQIITLVDPSEMKNKQAIAPANPS